MIFREKKMDIREIGTKEVIIAHCIAADLNWGSGIAPVIIRDMYDAEKQCRYKCSTNTDGFDGDLAPGGILPVVTEKGTFVNLITKEHSWDKPTYLQLTQSLVKFRDWVYDEYDTPKHIVMPRIGCGLDRLEWFVVENIIRGVFHETNNSVNIVYK